MILLKLLGITNAILASTIFKGICRVEFPPIFKFFKLMLIITAIRIGLQFTSITAPANGRDVMDEITLLSLLQVFWEDVFFTLPALMLDRLGRSGFEIGLCLAISAVAFASCHLAYGALWAGITLLYVPFLSYKYGRLYGLGTIMICHILYDVMTLLSVRLFE